MGTSSGYITNLLGGGVSIDSQAPWVDVRDVAHPSWRSTRRPAAATC